MGNEGLFYYRTALSMEICHSILSAFSARPTDLSQEAVRLTAGDGGPSTGGKHIQTLKVISYK